MLICTIAADEEIGVGTLISIGAFSFIGTFPKKVPLILEILIETRLFDVVGPTKQST